jgi:ankyrin repeat protein
MSAVAAHGHHATASSATLGQLPEYITPPVPSEPHIWYGSVHQQGLYTIISSHSDHIPDVSHVDRNSITSLTIFDAAMAGNLSALQELLKTHNANSIQPSTGLSALHYASSRGHIHLVNYLLDKAGATVDLEDREREVIDHITCGTDFCMSYRI